jgi:hypothetical protein
MKRSKKGRRSPGCELPFTLVGVQYVRPGSQKRAMKRIVFSRDRLNLSALGGEHAFAPICLLQDRYLCSYLLLPKFRSCDLQVYITL